MQTDATLLAKTPNNTQQCCDLLRPFAWDFSPTLLGVVGTCCVVHAKERNNCQHCRRLSKDALHSGTVILKKDCNARAQTFSRGQHCVGLCKRAQHCCATLPWSQNNRNVKLVASQTIRNKGQKVPKLLSGSVQTDDVLL